MNKEQKLVQALSRRKLSMAELSELIHKPNKITRNILYDLKRQHFNLIHSKGLWWIDDMRSTVKTYMYSPAQKTPSTLLYGSLSDLHIGCSLHRKDKLLDYFNRAYNEFGVKRFLVAGDLTDGIDVYHGQHNFLTQYNQQDQVDEVCEELPDWEGLEYLIVDGNHDYSFTKNGAPLTGKLISNQRSDIHYLGYNVGDIFWDGIRIRMLHGAGGGAYAVSYPIQRYLRNVMQSSRENLPDVMHVGHYHTRIDGFHAEGVTATSNGHFQEPNEWYVRRGYVGPMGGHIVDIEVENGKKKSFNARWLGE